jgi:adenosylcobinamide-GDP ribazoletransferase
MLNALLLAVSTLTIIPLSPDPALKSTTFKQSMIFYPWVGLLIGFFIALPRWLSLPVSLTSFWVLLFWVFFTRALHLDGVADCLDGWLGGKNASDRKRIMKDPSIGTFGLVGIVLLILGKYLLLTHLLTFNSNWRWLLIIPVLSRWAVTFSSTISKSPVQTSGLGASYIPLPLSFFWISTLETIGIGLLILHLAIFIPWLIAGLVAWGVTYLSKTLLGGLTGDGLGFIIELSELLILTYLSLGFRG